MPFMREHLYHLIAQVITDLYGDTTFLRFIEGIDRKCAFARRTTPESNLCIARQRINQLFTKTADPNHSIRMMSRRWTR